MTINPRTLFSQEILNYPVQTSDYGTVWYVNLDNAATTPPFLAVQKTVENFIRSYDSIHRGTGTKSIISTDLYERSHKIIKQF